MTPKQQTQTQQTQEELRADIARQRADLANTMNQLHERLDVRSRTRAKVAELKDRATTDEGRPRPAVVGGAAGATSLATAALWAYRSHHDFERKQMSKLSMLAAGGAGYVLGARAGRPRYEQIRDRAHKVVDNPSVRDLAHRISPGSGEHVREADFVEPFPPRGM